MERKLIQFAKVHGYLTGFIMMCSGIGIMALEFQPVQDFPLIFLLWLIFPICIFVAVLQEAFSRLKHIKQLYFGISIVGFIQLIIGHQEHTLKYIFPLLGALSAVTLYGFYVLRFLHKLFEDLNRRQGTIIMTTFVYGGSQPAAEAVASQRSQPVLPDQPEQNQSESSPPPSYETVVSMPDSKEQLKEFPVSN